MFNEEAKYVQIRLVVELKGPVCGPALEYI